MRLAWQREVYGTWRTHATDQWLVLSALLLALVPLWFFKYTPAADWPDHVAVSSVLYRLLHHDPSVEQFYTLGTHPSAYPLLYLVLTPCVGWLGPFIGAKIVLSGIAVLCVLAMTLCCQALARPQILGIGGIFIFYGAVFFWGFATTLVGVPLVIFTIWALLRCIATRHTGWLVTASLFAALAAAAHVVLAAAVVAAVLSFWCVDPKRHSVAALVLILATLTPAAPWLWRHGDQRVWAALADARYETPASAWNHVRAYLAAFDHGLGRAAHHGLLLFLLALMVLPKPRIGRAPQRFLTLFVLFSLALFLAVPKEMPALTGGHLCNVRYLTFVEVGLFLACVEPTSLTMRRALRYGVGMSFVLFLTGLVTLWQAFDATARPLDEVMDLVPAQSTMAVRSPRQTFEGAWPPLASRLSAYCLAHGLAFEDGALDNAEAPIHLRQPPRTVAEPLAMGNFDYVLIQGHPHHERGPTVQGGHLIKEAGIWQLYQRL